MNTQSANAFKNLSLNPIDKEVLSHSWVHYRHLENMRQKSLTFFYTLLFSVMAVLSVMIKDESFASNAVAQLVLYVLSSVVATFGVTTYINIAKLQAARSAHGRLINEIMLRSYGNYFHTMYNFPFRDQLVKSTPPIVTWTRASLFGIKSSSKELNASQIPTFIYLPIIILSFSTVYFLFSSSIGISTESRLIKVGCALINVSCTILLTINLFFPQNSWPEVGEPTITPVDGEGDSKNL